MQHESSVTTQEIPITDEDADSGNIMATAIERDPFLIALLEAVKDAVASMDGLTETVRQSQVSPAPDVQSQSVPSSAPARRRRPRFNFD